MLSTVSIPVRDLDAQTQAEVVPTGKILAARFERDRLPGDLGVIVELRVTVPLAKGPTEVKLHTFFEEDEIESIVTLESLIGLPFAEAKRRMQEIEYVIIGGE